MRDRAALVEPGRVFTASGEEIAADYVVLATGSSYPFPAKTDLVDAEHAFEQVRATHRALSKADRVLLLGAGPVGIELAGEIRSVWPDKSIVLLDARDEVLGGPFMPALRAELGRQLEEFKVEVLLGSPLREAATDRTRRARYFHRDDREWGGGDRRPLVPLLRRRTQQRLSG